MKYIKLFENNIPVIDEIIVDALNQVMLKYAPEDLTTWEYEIYGMIDGEQEYKFDFFIEGKDDASMGAAMMKVYINDDIFDEIEEEIQKLLLKSDSVEEVEFTMGRKDEKGRQVSNSRYYTKYSRNCYLRLSEWANRSHKTGLWDFKNKKEE